MENSTVSRIITAVSQDENKRLFLEMFMSLANSYPTHKIGKRLYTHHSDFPTLEIWFQTVTFELVDCYYSSSQSLTLIFVVLGNILF